MMYKMILLFAAIFFAGRPVLPQNIYRLDHSVISSKDLSVEVQRMMKSAHVSGMAITVFNDNKPVYSKAFGYKNAGKKDSLQLNTEFYGASLSKAVFAVLIMKLVEEGILDLDKPLQDYLPKPIYDYPPVTPRAWHEDYSNLKNDERYKKITARMCLDHTSGFPNWRWFEPDQKLRVKAEPGTRYEYSGEGMVYLQVVLEKMLNVNLESLMQEKIFRPLGMITSSYTWQDRFEQNFCYGHDTSENILPKDKDNAARSASTLETTPANYTRFLTAVLNNELISKGSMKLMFTPQIRLRSKSQFGPLSLVETTQYDPIQLSYGLGWGLYKTPYGWGAFKEGHGDGFQHYSVIFPESKCGILIMTNSDNGESIFKELLETAIGDIYIPWEWENYIPYDTKKLK